MNIFIMNFTSFHFLSVIFGRLHTSFSFLKSKRMNTYTHTHTRGINNIGIIWNYIYMYINNYISEIHIIYWICCNDSRSSLRL